MEDRLFLLGFCVSEVYNGAGHCHVEQKADGEIHEDCHVTCLYHSRYTAGCKQGQQTKEINSSFAFLSSLCSG